MPANIRLGGALGGMSDRLRAQASDLTPIDEDGGRLYATVGLVDTESGPIAAASINIAAATAVLARSTAGGAFNPAGITQPVMAKIAGLVLIEGDVVAGEWSAGDTARLTVNGIVVTIAAANLSLPQVDWTFQIQETVDITAGVASIRARVAMPQFSGTHNHISNILEQDILDQAVVTPLIIQSLWFDFQALTQNVTIRLYHDIATLERQFGEFTHNVADAPGYLIEGPITVDDDFRVTLQSAVLEGAVRAIPYKFLYENRGL